MNFEYVDNLYRSRLTLLDLLEARGYDVETYRKFSPLEISVVSPELLPSLGFTVSKKDDVSKKCQIRYARSISRQKLDESFSDVEDPENTEIVVMLLEMLSDAHHAAALKQFMTRKLKVFMFSISHIVNNPLLHVMVPKHEIVPLEQHKELMDSLHITKKTQLPLIQFYDPIIRCIGGVVGDIIKITRPSPSAGQYIVYRIVSP